MMTDFYIIPLTRKLKDCGVFGASSSDYLDKAMRNRAEWEIRGREVVHEMVQRIQLKTRMKNGSDVRIEKTDAQGVEAV